MPLQPVPADPAAVSDTDDVFPAVEATSPGDQPAGVRRNVVPRPGRPVAAQEPPIRPPVGRETRPPQPQGVWDERRWPQSPPLDGDHVTVGEPMPVGRGDMELARVFPTRPIHREPPDAWDAPLMRVQ